MTSGHEGQASSDWGTTKSADADQDAKSPTWASPKVPMGRFNAFGFPEKDAIASDQYSLFKRVQDLVAGMEHLFSLEAGQLLLICMYPPTMHDHRWA
jgi:hypothetical protein